VFLNLRPKRVIPREGVESSLKVRIEIEAEEPT
jgi:hypothetical protein